MAAKDDEEERLRAVALQNAQAVLLARLRAEEALRKQSEWLRVTLASIGDAVISTDAEGRVTFMNGVAEALTGWPLAEAAGRPLPDVFRIVNEHTRQAVENPALRALREGTIVGLANHTVLVARDGRERPIDDSASPMRDGGGDTLGAVLVFRDVTERKHAENLLRRKEAELTDFIENATVGLHWVGPDGTILWVNRAELDLLGYAKEEYVGRNIVEFHADRPVIDDILCRLVNREELRGYEARLRCKDGSIKHVLINSNGLWEGERFVHTRCFTHDVTDKKRADEAQARLAAIVESSDDAVISKTLDGIIRSWNAGAERLFGYTAREAVGQPITLIIPAERQDEERAILERLRRGERMEHFETVRVAKDGHRLDISLTVSPVRDEEGHIIGASKIARDVTARRREAASLEGQKKILELIAQRAALPDVLASLCRLVEEQSGEEVLGSILLADIDGGRLRHGAAPSLPDAYNRAIDGVPIGPAEGSCGTAAFRREPVYVTDIATDPLWDDYRELALAHGLRSCWSQPILAGDGAVIGTFAMYYRAPRQPVPEDLRLVDLVTRTAAIAVESTRAAKAERQLLAEVEAERGRLADVFHGAPSFLAILRGPEHVFELANERYYQLIGDRGIIGKPVREALPEVAGQGFFELLDGVYQSGEPFVGTDMRVVVQRDARGAPEERFVEFVYQPLRGADGSVSGIIAQGIDLTERKRAEAAVRERDERLRLFLGNATDYAFIITDPDGLTLVWEGGAEQITGWQADEMFGRTASVIFTAEEREAGLPEAEMAKAARDGRAEDKRWHVKKDGSRFFADGVMVSLRGPAGELRGFGKVIRDATEQKRAEDALRDADRRKDEFIALLAHELRNPLAPLRSGLQVMRMAGGDAAAVAQARGMMERQLGHMVRLIDDLLDISRINQNKMELRRSRVLLADVASSAVETARPAIESAGHELTITLPQEPVYLDADLTRLGQVFSNLLTNSAKYTERGGHIWLSAERRDADVVVTVRDTGIGIPADSLPRIFDMFSQVDRSIERSTGGLGIGLALVKGLVGMHDGTVTAASEGQGKGSTFTVKLPALGALMESLTDVPSDNGQATTGPRRRILVVDDNRDSATSMAMMLKLMGNDVRTAHDGMEAVEVAEGFRPQVILMDVGMPRLNGLDAARRIREQPWGRSVVIIALTGWGQEGDKERSREAGCNGHLVKPVNLPDLEKLVAELTGENSSRE